VFLSLSLTHTHRAEFEVQWNFRIYPVHVLYFIDEESIASHEKSKISFKHNSAPFLQYQIHSNSVLSVRNACWRYVKKMKRLGRRVENQLPK
jgi:hypothetical protein